MRMQYCQMQDRVGAAKRRRGPAGVSALLGLVVGLGLTPSGWATTYTFSSIDFNASGTTVATGINDNGQIVGSYHDGFGDHGFLATPVLASVPEPASGVLLSLGLAALGGMAIWNRRWRKTDALAGL